MEDELPVLESEYSTTDHYLSCLGPTPGPALCSLVTLDLDHLCRFEIVAQ